MALWNDSLWNGPSGTGVTAGHIIGDALRIAGITQRAGFGPDEDQVEELRRALNRLMGQLNCQANAIYGKSIESFPVVAGQQTYTIGVGGEWDTDRPQRIEIANFVYGSAPWRIPMRILDDQEWGAIQLQSASSNIPAALYNDGANPISTIYLYYVPSGPGSVELYLWSLLKSDFVSVDDVAEFPPGYAEAITLHLAIKAAMLYPLQQAMMKEVFQQAAIALANVKSLNSSVPKLYTDAPQSNQGCGPSNWRTISILGPYAR
jgi:hypothetical protein